MNDYPLLRQFARDNDLLPVVTDHWRLIGPDGRKPVFCEWWPSTGIVIFDERHRKRARIYGEKALIAMIAQRLRIPCDHYSEVQPAYVDYLRELVEAE